MITYEPEHNIRTMNDREVQIENSVMRVTVRHHDGLPSDAKQLSRVASDRIFISNRTIITDSFSCILFFRQLHLGLDMCCFINFMLK